MTPKEFFIAFFGKTLNMPADEVASTFFSNDDGTELKADAIKDALKLDVSRVETINKKQFENGQKKATKELMSDFEKQLREKFDTNSDKQGIELIEDIIASKTTASGDIDETKVKTHPVFLDLEKRLKAEVKNTEKTWKDKYEGFEKQVQKDKTFSSIVDKADAYLSEFALPDDKVLAKNQKRLLLDELKKLDYQFNGEDIIILTEDGKPLEDGHGNKRSLEDLVKTTAANYWPKLNGQQRSGAGGTNDNPGAGNAGNAWKGKVPANEQEYSSLIAGAKTAEERMAITDAYDQARARG